MTRWGSGPGGCEAVQQGCELQKERVAPGRNEKREDEACFGIHIASRCRLGGFSMPVRSHRRPSQGGAEKCDRFGE